MKLVRSCITASSEETGNGHGGGGRGSGEGRRNGKGGSGEGGGEREVGEGREGSSPGRKNDKESTRRKKGKGALPTPVKKKLRNL